MHSEALLGLPLAEARKRLDAIGSALVRVVKSEPPRPRQPFPPEAEWRVVRVNADDTGVELVVVPPTTGPNVPAVSSGPADPVVSADPPDTAV